MLVDHGRSAPGEFASALAAQSSVIDPVMLKGSDPFVLFYTSGTTGSPKGVRWPLTRFLQNAVYMRDAVDLQPVIAFGTSPILVGRMASAAVLLVRFNWVMPSPSSKGDLLSSQRCA